MTPEESKKLEHELLKSLHLTISEEQIPFEFGKRIRIKISFEDTEIASDYFDIQKGDLE